MKNQIEYNVGDIVKYQTFGGDIRRCKVQNKEKEIKKGKPGFDGVELNKHGKETGLGGVWGYDYQIISVEK